MTDDESGQVPATAKPCRKSDLVSIGELMDRGFREVSSPSPPPQPTRVECPCCQMWGPPDQACSRCGPWATVGEMFDAIDERDRPPEVGVFGEEPWEQ